MIDIANIKQINVLSDIFSLNNTELNVVKIIIPIPNPINRDGHSSPLAYLTKLSTDLI